MPSQSDLRHDLYLKASQAFQAALEAAIAKPSPGTKEWDEWQRLVGQALVANQDYVSFLRGRSDDFRKPTDPDYFR